MVRQPDPRLLALSPERLVLATLYGEARGEPIEAQVGILHVIHNRLTSGRWGTTYHTTLLAWAQFSCLWPGLAGEKAFQHLIHFVTKDPAQYTALERQLEGLTLMLFDDALIDNTKGSTHYFTITPQLIQDPPRWTKPPAIQTVQLGHEVFYRNVP